MCQRWQGDLIRRMNNDLTIMKKLLEDSIIKVKLIKQEINDIQREDEE